MTCKLLRSHTTTVCHIRDSQHVRSGSNKSTNTHRGVQGMGMGLEQTTLAYGTKPELFLLTSLATSMPHSGADHGVTPRQ